MQRRILTRACTQALPCLLALMLPNPIHSQPTTSARSLQQAVTHAMTGKAGTAVVIDAASGKILAVHRLHTAAQRVALPGSSIKPFTLLTLLNSGTVNQQTTWLCKRPLTLAGHNLSCTHPELKQPFDPVMALAYSCNSYFAAMAARLTPVELRNGFQSFGFGSPSGLAPGEAAGNVPLASTTEELQLEALGEGGIHVTPLQLLRAYQMLERMQVNHDARLEPVYQGLEASVANGMGHLAQPDASLKVAGKTGTSLVEEGFCRHGWFAGYAPAHDPKIVLVVFLEKGNGPVDAAGVAREIFTAYAASQANGASH